MGRSGSQFVSTDLKSRRVDALVASGLDDSEDSVHGCLCRHIPSATSPAHTAAPSACAQKHQSKEHIVSVILHIYRLHSQRREEAFLSECNACTSMDAQTWSRYLSSSKIGGFEISRAPMLQGINLSRGDTPLSKSRRPR